MEPVPLLPAVTFPKVWVPPEIVRVELPVLRRSWALAVPPEIAWLPPLAALVSLIWGLIRIYETETIKGWRSKRKVARRIRSRKDAE